jgi:hypothetical protein
MRRIFFVVLLGFAGGLFTGCETLQELFASLGAAFESEDSGGSGSDEGGRSGSAARGSGARLPQGRGYSLPASYDAAYSYRTETPYPNMRNIPRNIEANRVNNPDEYIRQVTAYINESSANDFERVKRAHDLVALTVRYDAASFWANKIPDQDYRSVLKGSLAVCEGYSALFKKLCEGLRIPCETVHGFGRGVGTSPFSGDTPTDSNHAWSIVTINGESYLIDCTWDAGYMDGRVSKQRYTTDWLFLRPEHFLHTHFPENPRQQLLQNPVSASAFLDLPFLEPKYFEVVEDMFPALSKINEVEGKTVFEYGVKEGFEVSFNIYNESGRELPNNSFAQKEGDVHRAYFSFPKTGNHLVRIFWKKAGANTGSSCGEIGFIAGSSSAIQYPTQYSSSGKNLEISPIEMPLRRGQKYLFRVRVDNKRVVAIIYGRTFLQMAKGEDEYFTQELEIPASIREISIGIADSPQGRYENIVRYTVAQ